MASPFPGMDPFIEGDSWQDFHFAFIAEARQFLIPHLRPRYVVRAQERVYLEQVPENGMPGSFNPDVSVVVQRDMGYGSSGGGTATAVAEEPVMVTLPMPVQHQEPYLTILWRETMEVVTVIEVLSPTNKRPGSTGRRKYLAKRHAVLASESHLVELDLLRGGERLPTVQPLPPADYYALVSRSERRPRAEAYAWPMFQRMPAIPIPLYAGDADVKLDLQAVFDTVYNRSDYDYSLDYSRTLEGPLSNPDAVRVQELLNARSR